MPIHPRLVRLRPRPETLHLSRGFLVLATDRDGFVADGSEHGLFVHETRMLSRYRWLLDGEAPHPVALSNLEQHSWLGYYAVLTPGATASEKDGGSGMMEALSNSTLELRLRRSAAAGVREEIRLANHAREPTAFQLALEVDADFADLQETRGGRKQTGRCERSWDEAARTLAFDYRAEHAFAHQDTSGTASVHRRLRIRVAEAASPPRFEASGEGARIAFEIALPPRGTWAATLEWIPETEPLALLGREPTPFEASFEDWAARDRRFLEAAPAFETAESETLAHAVAATLERARLDLAALRLHDLDTPASLGGEPAEGWTMAAGLPIYLALYGRDTLTAAWEAALLGPEMLAGTLATLARLQGREDDAWRDEAPGRMLHEAHTGPLKVLGFNPFGRYYGSMTTSAFFPVAAAEMWHWTGDRDAAFASLKPALEALRWLDERSARGGFYAYQTRSEQGVKHQAWKDSGTGVVDAEGRPVEPPIATCEEQAFVYQAKFILAEMLYSLGSREEARRLFHEAGALKARFNEAFWMEEEGFYAFGLDAEGRPIRAITSNPGHALATAIVPRERAARVAERLFQPDLFSGWGIRTLSAENPAYNPYSYHRGSVWPVEQGTFALALMRYGLWERLHELARALFEAAALFEHYRLPEVFGGHERSEAQPFPAFYPQANSPQAWSASAVLTIVQALLGLYPYAPLRLLVVDPHLPAWLPELTLRGLRVGPARATIRFFRTSGGASSYRVEDVEGPLHVVRQPSPWSLSATVGERLVDALASLVK